MYHWINLTVCVSFKKDKTKWSRDFMNVFMCLRGPLILRVSTLDYIVQPWTIKFFLFISTYTPVYWSLHLLWTVILKPNKNLIYERIYNIIYCEKWRPCTYFQCPKLKSYIGLLDGIVAVIFYTLGSILYMDGCNKWTFCKKCNKNRIRIRVQA